MRREKEWNMKEHIRMKYRYYKQHYSDCKTVPGSYDDTEKTVIVIIPQERFKPSGTRGQKFCYFSGVEAKDKDGNIVNLGGFKALSWENACKQIRKLGYEPI